MCPTPTLLQPHGNQIITQGRDLIWPAKTNVIYWWAHVIVNMKTQKAFDYTLRTLQAHHPIVEPLFFAVVSCVLVCSPKTWQAASHAGHTLYCCQRKTLDVL